MRHRTKNYSISNQTKKDRLLIVFSHLQYFEQFWLKSIYRMILSLENEVCCSFNPSRLKDKTLKIIQSEN